MPRVRKRVKPVAQSGEEVQTVTVKPVPGMIEERDDREVVVHKFIAEPAYVRVQAGVTKSLGAGTYEFLKLDVSISVPCYKEDVQETFEEVAERVSVLLDQEVTNYLGASDGEDSA